MKTTATTTQMKTTATTATTTQMKTYQLKCFAPNGEHVTEGRGFPSVEAAWDRAEDMGSRWFFYPVCIVTGKNRIIATPRELRPFIGRSIRTLAKWFAANADMVCAWVNGEAPFESPYPYATAGRCSK